MFVWNSSYEVGISLVDQQHQRLLDLMNEMETAMDHNLNDETLTAVAKALVDYTVYHFSEEENIMAECQYTETKHHQREHKKFIEKLGAAHSLDDIITKELAESLHAFLAQWLVAHILVSDKKLGAFYNGHPVTADDEINNFQRQLEISNAEHSLLMALRESEKRFRLLTNNTPVLVWMAAANGKRTYFNKRWLDYVGMPLHRQVEGDWMTAIHPEDQTGYQAFLGTLQAADTLLPTEFRLRGHDGIYRWFVEQVAPLWDDRGARVGFIGSCLDISKRKEARIPSGPHQRSTGTPGGRAHGLLADGQRRSTA